MSKNKIAPLGYLSPHGLAGVPLHTPVLLAFSGGADSRVLLALLAEAAKKEGFPLLAAHVNHGIRGEEALRDRAFCQRIAQECGVELCLLDVDIPSLAKESGRGLEEEARAVRYAFFERLMKERNIPMLVTAHHADDHLETLLFRICRGSGLRGLGGIAPVRAFANGVLVRPLLRCTKREILEYCQAKGLEFVTDCTNADPLYARNRIRAKVTPVLEGLFDDVAARTVEMSAELREDEAYLDSLASEFLAREHDPQGLSLEALRSLPLPILRRVLRTWVRQCCGQDAERVHIDALIKEVQLEQASRAEVALPASRRAACEMGRLRLLTDAGEQKAGFEPFDLCEGEFAFGNGEVRLCVKKEENGRKIHNLSTQTGINSSLFSVIIKDGLYWRMRREGDLLLMGGMHRKLRKLYNAAKIPPRLRDEIPVLCDAEGIVWAPFAGCRDGMAPCDSDACYVARVEIL